MAQPKMNVESFNLDHTQVVAPYVRIADIKHLPKGDVLTKFDLRFTQPNVAHLEMDTVHSIEHLFAEYSRNFSSQVIDFSPMGCQTGFYLILEGDHSDDVPAVIDLVDRTITAILHDADTVPAANEVQCGWGANHTLQGARSALKEFQAQKEQWLSVFA